MLLHREGLFDALLQASTARSTKVFIPPSHPHLSNIFQTAVWLLFCYLLLFYLICTNRCGLGTVHWLDTCMRQANLSVLASEHLNVRIFLASVIAGWGTVPFAVMSCAFLPKKSPPVLIVSDQGLLLPNSILPLKVWTDLKAVTVAHADDARRESVRLIFKNGGSVKLKVSALKQEQLAAVLAAADEFASGCSFDESACALRARLADSVRANSSKELSRFQSTTFTPHKSGEFLGNAQYRIVKQLAGKSMSSVYLRSRCTESTCGN